MGRMFDDDGQVIDREALKSLAFGTVALREPGTPGGPSSGMTFSEAMDRGAHKAPAAITAAGER